MYKFRKGQRFGNWKVLSSQRLYKEVNGRKYPHIKCMDIRCGLISLVRVNNLIHGTSRGHISLKGGNKGHSTRVKNKHLPKYVYAFPNGNKIYRVCKKINGSTVTVGYYSTLKEAERVAANENQNL